MASSPSPPPPPAAATAAAASRPPTVSNSDNSDTAPPSPPPSNHKVEGKEASENGTVPNIVEEEKPEIPSLFKILDSVEYLDKCKKYEADYTRRLMSKYFSSKNLYGGNIFDEKLTIDDETIMSSRWPCTQSFANPVKSFEEQSSGGSTSTSEPE